MLNKENKDLCWRVLSKYGCQGQMMMVIEECSELQKAVCKINRDDGHATANFMPISGKNLLILSSCVSRWC